MSNTRLSNDDVDRIVGLLSSWTGKLTWTHLVDRVEGVLGTRYTRQGLDKHFSITTAFKKAKERNRKRNPLKLKPDDEGLPPDLAMALRTNEALRAQIEVLKAERDRFLEKFAVWLYNARSRGLSEQDLNRSLPRIDRQGSEKK